MAGALPLVFLIPGFGVAGEAFLVQGFRVVFHQGGWVGLPELGLGARAGSFRQGAVEQKKGGVRKGRQIAMEVKPKSALNWVNQSGSCREEKGSCKKR